MAPVVAPVVNTSSTTKTVPFRGRRAGKFAANAPTTFQARSFRESFVWETWKFLRLSHRHTRPPVAKAKADAIFSAWL